jgi:hypothetical protein
MNCLDVPPPRFREHGSSWSRWPDRTSEDPVTGRAI